MPEIDIPADSRSRAISPPCATQIGLSPAAIAAVCAAAVDAWAGRHQVKVHTHDGADRVDQRNCIRTPRRAARAGCSMLVTLGVSFDDHRQAGVLLAPARNHLDVLRNLATAEPMRAPTCHGGSRSSARYRRTVSSTIGRIRFHAFSSHGHHQ